MTERTNSIDGVAKTIAEILKDKMYLLAASLDPQAHEKNPGFVRFVRSSGLDFRPHDAFTATSVTERGDLYRAIDKQVWNPKDLLRVAGLAGVG